MAGVTLPDVRPWGRRPLTIPPTSANAWIQLAVWELWMGMLVCIMLGLGVLLVAASPDRLFAVSDLTSCYGPPPVAVPCERILYRGGQLHAVFTAFFGLVLILGAAWFLWELWGAVEPKPITDDFLRLLHDSFGRDWRNPLTWPWARALWAYGFALVGATVTAGIAVLIWTFAASSQPPARTPTVSVETSQTFLLGR